jgi:hypothetical protein
MTSTPDTLPNYINMHKTQPNRQEDRVSKEASSPTPIPLSTNYFDILSVEEDAPPEETTFHETQFPGTKRAIALSLNPKKKALMPLGQQEAEATEEALQLALHRSREDAQRRSQGGEGKGLRIG